MERETARMDAFSDAVFAIAITLLILDLHVPAISDISSPGELKDHLLGAWPAYLAFVLSFFSIFILWVNHHKIFKQIYKRNTAVTFVNGLILFLVTAVSYPTSLLARFYNTSSSHLVVAVYTGLFVLINLAFNLLWYVATRDKDLLRPGLTPEAIVLIRKEFMPGLPMYLIAFVLSFLWPSVALLICMLLWVYWAYSSGKLMIPDKGVD